MADASPLQSDSTLELVANDRQRGYVKGKYNLHMLKVMQSLPSLGHLLTSTQEIEDLVAEAGTFNALTES